MKNKSSLMKKQLELKPQRQQLKSKLEENYIRNKSLFKLKQPMRWQQRKE